MCLLLVASGLRRRVNKTNVEMGGVDEAIPEPEFRLLGHGRCLVFGRSTITFGKVDSECRAECAADTSCLAYQYTSSGRDAGQCDLIQGWVLGAIPTTTARCWKKQPTGVL